jgi:hypothetical protein
VRKSLTKRIRRLMVIVALSYSITGIAAPVTYVDLALGLGVHVLEGSDQGAASKLIKAGIGVQWFPFISTQVGGWSWSSEDQAKREAEEDSEAYKVGLFDGISVSWEVALQWPIDNAGGALSAGPYVRYGQHCWSAVLAGLAQPWSKEGCSNLNALGFAFPLGEGEDAGLYIEFTQTDFDDLTSSSLQLGAKLAY